MRHAAADLEFGETPAMLATRSDAFETYDLEMPADSVPINTEIAATIQGIQTPSPPRPRKPTAPECGKKRQTGTTRPRPNGLAHSANGRACLSGCIDVRTAVKPPGTCARVDSTSHSSRGRNTCAAQIKDAIYPRVIRFGLPSNGIRVEMHPLDA
ncbi:MAG: hypothetical protein CM15mP87_01490 [Candidatus Neomarinimicrobiota bacterium]|nr:MAG: hypothetical protein CM15mP87_01490 [Candidatus Neomarinimicrobiota bacterium]